MQTKPAGVLRRILFLVAACSGSVLSAQSSQINLVISPIANDTHAFRLDVSGTGGIVMRVLAELVANAVKHGTGDIVLTVSDADDLTVRLSNRIAAGAGRAPGSGIGITGAQLLLDGSGASLDSAPGDEGEWNALLTISEEPYV